MRCCARKTSAPASASRVIRSTARRRKSSSRWPTLRCIFRNIRAATPSPPPITLIPTKPKNGSVTVLEAYLGVTLKRLFSTGPEAFEEIYQRLRQFTESLAATEPNNGILSTPAVRGPQALPQAVLDTVTSLAFAIDAKDHYTQGHSQKVSAYAALIAEALGMKDNRSRGDSSGRCAPRHRQGGHTGKYSEQERPAQSRRVGNDEVARQVWREDPGPAYASRAHPRNGSPPPRILRRHRAIPRPWPGRKFRWAPASLPSPTLTTPSPATAPTRRPATPQMRWPSWNAARTPSLMAPSWKLFVRTMRALPNPIIEVAATYRSAARQLTPPLQIQEFAFVG